MKKRLSAFILFVLFASTMFAQSNNINYGSNPQAGHYALVNGIKLYYETYGSGKPLIMLHGNGGSIEAFKNQIPFFEKQYKVIAIDSRPGTIGRCNGYAVVRHDGCRFCRTA
jgi:hypothetical protein